MANDLYPLTHAQQRIWYTEMLHPGTPMWNNAGTLKIRGEINLPLLEQAVLAYIRASSSIRLRITLKDNVPMQYVGEEIPVRLDMLDFTGRGTTALYEWDSMLTHVPISLLDGNLFYFALYRLSDTEGGLYIKAHHIISDALSLVNFSNTVMENYRALLSGQDLPERSYGNYMDFILSEQAYMHSKRYEDDRLFWLGRFCNIPEPTLFKQARGALEKNTRANRAVFSVPQDLSAGIRAVCAQQGVSVFSLFLTALCLYLNRITGEDDIVVSAPVYNRTAMRLQNVFGMFISTVPVRIQIQDHLTFRQLVRVVAQEWFSVLKHQKYPYDMLMRELRKENPGLESLYDITLSYQNAALDKQEDRFACKGRWHFSGHQANAINIHINDREREGYFLIDYDYLVPQFSPKEVEYIHTHLMNILFHTLKNPDEALYRIDFLSEEERGRVLRKFNDTFADYPRNETALDLFLRCVKRTPDKTAVSCDGQALTYRQLHDRAQAYARRLAKCGVGCDDIVALLVERTLHYPVWVLAVAMAGGAYLPIDCELPKERIDYMLSDSGARVLVASPCLYGQYAGDAHVSVFREEEDPIGDTGEGEAYALDLPKAGDLAYIIYTSGSTGQPKGAMIEHGGLYNFMRALAEIWDFSPPDCRVLGSASVSFDLSVMELWAPITHGGTLILATERQQNTPADLARLLIEERVNMMLLTPGRMELLLSDAQANDCLRGFREVALGGDVVSEALLERVRARTRAKLYNMYGPTEITVVATCKEITSVKGANIGRPLSNVTAYILDGHRNPVPVGVHGELYIGGRGLARGYIGKPEMTADRFVENPFCPGEKLYRSGDLCRWYPRGEIEYLGRIDAQVKIRGFRIELGEIESTLLQLANIEACAVIDRAHASGRKYLCAYVCGGALPTRTQMKAHLSQQLPAYMIPAYFVALDALPLNASGKVDRKQLPDPDELGLGAGEYVPPVTDTERELAMLWAKELKGQRIGREDDFFDIGGDSLTVLMVRAQVQRTMYVDIPLEEIYRASTLRGWAAAIDAAVRDGRGYTAVYSAGERPFYPASSAQQRMYVLAKTAPDSLAYHVPVCIEFDGKLDARALTRALERLVKRHDVLRSALVLRDGRLVQKVCKVRVPLKTIECSRVSVSMLRGLIAPIDLSKPPLFHATLITPEHGRQVLLLDVHHAVCDMRSVEVLLRELPRLYAGEDLPACALQYRDYAVWQQEILAGGKLDDQRAFWRHTLSGEIAPLALRTRRPRTAERLGRGATARIDVGAARTRSLHAFVAKRQATMYMLMLAVYTVALSKYTGQEDIVVGTPVLGRERAEFSGMMGMFVDTAPMRNKPVGAMTFEAFFSSVRENCQAAYANADYPLEAIVRDLGAPRDMARHPLFDVMLTYRAGESPVLNFRGISGRMKPFDWGSAKLDLTLDVSEGADGIHLALEYDTALYDRRFARQFLRHFAHLLERLTESPDARIQDVNPMPDAELQDVVYGFNRTRRPIDLTVPLTRLFERHAEEHGERTALIVSGERMSYAQLNRESNRYASAFRAHGVRRGDIVALCVRRSFALMAGILGALKAGAAYLPVDIAFPVERILFMLNDAGVKVVLSDMHRGIQYSGIVLTPEDIEAEPGACVPPADNIPSDPAYVIYTSGSTGVPKGVTLTRQGVINLYEAARDMDLFSSDDIVLSATTASFDIFVEEALVPLFFGLPVALATEEELRQPRLLADVLHGAGATWIQTTPTRMRILMDETEFRRAAKESIRTMLLAGEKMPPALVRLLKANVPGARIVNGYGPSETTVYASYADLTHTSRITIGRPIINAAMYILDEYGQPVPAGVQGELYIGGVGVGIGYIHREALNAERFLPNPFEDGRMYRTGDICAYLPSGEIEIFGRTDDQLKIHGMRVELGEIESAMRAVPGVEEAVIRAQGEGEELVLSAYYTGAQADPAALRKRMYERLPAYMVPAYFTRLKTMPLTPSGKIDKKALPPPDISSARPRVSQAPRGDMERLMAQIWSKVLGVKNVGRDDDFFALGGDSLKVIRVQAALAARQITLRTQDFFDHKTLSAICARLGTAFAGEGGPRERRSIPPRTAPMPAAYYGSVLLTGATGFLGAHILRELAGRSARIFALVRGADAGEKLRAALGYYFPGEADALFERVIPVAGDISEPGLGLSKDLRGVDSLVHCAALTDHIGYREHFYKANILGTKNAVEWCKRHRAHLLHISTLSVSGTEYRGDPRKCGDFTEHDYDIGQVVEDNEYVNSKFIAEGYVLSAVAEGLCARIFRVGNLTSRIHDGVFQQRPERNAFAARLRAIAHIGAAEESGVGMAADLTPVDLCARAVLELAERPDTQYVYHLAGTPSICGRDLLLAMARRGISVQTLPAGAFQARIGEAGLADDRAAMAGIRPRHVPNITVSCAQTLRRLNALKIAWPSIDEDYIDLYLNSILGLVQKGDVPG